MRIIGIMFVLAAFISIVMMLLLVSTPEKELGRISRKVGILDTASTLDPIQKQKELIGHYERAAELARQLGMEETRQLAQNNMRKALDTLRHLQARKILFLGDTLH
jgi:hypothetical protein